MVRHVSLAAAVFLIICGSACTVARRPQVVAVSDASHIEVWETSIVKCASSSPREAEKEIARLVRTASKDGTKVSIAGARHTMGGHTVSPRGVSLDMTGLNWKELLPDGKTLGVGAGATWAEVIPYLNERGRSVAIMQSNNDFTVGGSISANCHGWQVGRPPIVDSVKSIRIVTPSGIACTASRNENPALFRHAIGGYGLFGVITEVELETVPNRCYLPSQTTLSPKDFDAAWRRLVDEKGDVEMAYGRLSVSRGHLFENALLTTFRTCEGETPRLEAKLRSDAWLRRQIFRCGCEWEPGKWFRWEVESHVGELLGGGKVSRNAILNEPSFVYAESSPARTDILHEYFIPRHRIMEFLPRAAEIITRHRGNIMNVTIRQVLPDHETALPYAREECFAFVMLFNYRPEEDSRYAGMTRELINVALASGGTYYLPYRLHATPEQFHAAYPSADDFLAAKRRCDPGLVFQNKFFTYATQDHGAGK